MKRLLLAASAAFALCLPVADKVQAQTASVVAACGAQSLTPGINTTNVPLLLDSTGNLCTSATAGGGSTIIGAATYGTSAALESNHVIKASAGTLFSFTANADATLAAASWYLMIFDATSAPVDGAVTPAKCYQVPSGTTQVGGTFNAGGVAFLTGITMVLSTTGCFTKTASAHGAVSGDFK